MNKNNVTYYRGGFFFFFAVALIQEFRTDAL